MAKKILTLLMVLVMMLTFGVGCGITYDIDDGNVTVEGDLEDTLDGQDAYDLDEDISYDDESDEAYEADAEGTIDESGVYTSKEDVSLYIHTYGHLPDNFITKKEAKSLGWEGGSLEDYAPGCSIGGDYFGNYEGLLPEDKTYHECDIDTMGASKRGTKRIVFSDDGCIYYTGDHYETFELLYGVE